MLAWSVLACGGPGTHSGTSALAASDFVECDIVLGAPKGSLPGKEKN